MKFLKSGLIFACFALFIFACNQASNTVNNAVSNTNSNSRANTNTMANSGANSTPADELAGGKKVYMDTCGKCHKEDGTGGAVEVMGEKHTAANLKSDKMKKMSDADYVSVIQNGEVEEGMPAFKGRLSDEQINSVVKFIRSEFQSK